MTFPFCTHFNLVGDFFHTRYAVLGKVFLALFPNFLSQKINISFQQNYCLDSIMECLEKCLLNRSEYIRKNVKFFYHNQYLIKTITILKCSFPHLSHFTHTTSKGALKGPCFILQMRNTLRLTYFMAHGEGTEELYQFPIFLFISLIPTSEMLTCVLWLTCRLEG